MTSFSAPTDFSVPETSVLLADYVRDGSQTAFGQLVRRYVNFVHGTALRSLGGDSALADDVTQAVFLVLSQKAGSIKSARALPSWLHRTTRYAVANARKSMQRRSHHERIAASERPEVSMTADPDPLLPHLDDAIASLGTKDQSAVIARYLQGRPMDEVAVTLGISVDAAQKRCERAIEKLHRFFTRKKLGATTIGVTALLAAESGHAAPVTVVSTLTNSSFAASTVSTSAAGIAKGTMHMMTWIKLQFAAIFTTIAVALVTVGYTAIDVARADAPTTAPSKLTATFADGMIVELQTVYDTVSKTWWDPFGTPLSSGSYDPAIQGNRTQSLEYFITIRGGPEKNWNATNIKWTANNTRSLGFAGVKSENARQGRDIRLINMEPGADKTNVKLAFSMGDEQSYALLTLGESAIATADIPRLGTVELSNPREVNGQGAIDAIIPKPPEGMQVIVTARPVRNGNEPVTPILSVNRADALGWTDNELKTVTFNAKLSSIRSVEVRVRSYDRWVEFRDLSLKPGAHSAASVVTSEDVKPAMNDALAFQGKWELAAAAKNGKLAPAEEIRGVFSIITSTEMTIVNKNNIVAEAATYTLDPEKRQFDLRDRKAPDRVVPGLYNLNGDNLTLYYDDQTLRRPQKMPVDTAQAISGKMLILKRSVPAPVAANADNVRQQAMLNLRAIATAAIKYTQDHRGMMPANLMDLVMQKYLSPHNFSPEYAYLADDQVRIPRLGNDLATTALAYDQASLKQTGSTGVAFTDGHVEWVDKAKLDELLQKSKETYDRVRRP